MRVIFLVLLFSALDALALPTKRVDFVQVLDGATMSVPKTRRVTTQVRRAYNQLRLPIRFSPLRTIRIGFGPTGVNERLRYAYRVMRKMRPRRATYVFIPMSTDGFSWGYMLTKNFACGTATERNLRGQDRFWFSVNTAVHEIGHLLGPDHDDTSANVMHPDALRFVTNRVLPFPWWFKENVLWRTFGVEPDDECNGAWAC